MTTYFDALGLETTASAADVKSAFRKLARELHPDVNPANARKFALVTAAYNALMAEDGLANGRWGFGKGFETWRRDWEELNGLVGRVRMDGFERTRRNAAADDINDLIRDMERRRREANRMREEDERLRRMADDARKARKAEEAKMNADAPKTSAKPGRCGKHTKSGDCIRPEGHPHSCMSQQVADQKKANAKARKAAGL